MALGNLYAMFVDLSGAPCLVVGGGRVAERRAGGLVGSGAEVAVVSPSVTDALARWRDAGLIEVRSREYEPGDVRGARLVIAATDNPDLNARIVLDARDSGALANSVTRAPGATFVVPSSVRKGGLQIAVSTGGGSPALSRAVSGYLEESLPGGLDELAQWLERVRTMIQEVHPRGEKREDLLRRLAKPEALAAWLRGDCRRLKETAAALSAASGLRFPPPPCPGSGDAGGVLKWP